MVRRRELEKHDVPEYMQSMFDFTDQKVGVVSKGRTGMLIRFVCNSCDNRPYVSVQTILGDVKRGRKKTGECGKCRFDGRIITQEGYVWVTAPKDHPSPISNGKYVPEHRLVMENSLGRYLTSEESVHHINGVRDDNRIENLQLRNRYHGKGIVKRCVDCGSHNIESVAL